MSYLAEGRWKNRLSVSNSALTIRDLQQEDFGTFTFSKLVEPTTVKAVQTFKLSKIAGKRIKYSIMSHTMSLIPEHLKGDLILFTGINYRVVAIITSEVRFYAAYKLNLV